ncbi:KAP family P-loop NTPase fold protein [Confluentibacter sediminis]|uniref:KAP family P-loop NTPase fold protein n=1 Tax=Confluentibacter sediminis TaxID=2219045 RepID=UPI0013A6C766|nr:P-loop NTPase fold protein [Confluentibacter sediminis]
MKSIENKNLITNEIAIKTIEGDLLGYHPFAKKIQKIIQGYSSNSEPLTIGIYGKWGSGKSSLLNLIERHIEIFHKDKGDKPYIKFHYNPWIYQTKEEMLFDFFETLSRKLNYSGSENLKKAGKFIKKYSRYLKAVKLSASVGVPKMFNAGITVEPYEILQKLGEDLEGEDKGLNELKEDIDKSLNESSKKIIIFIDDVDRLDKDEIFTLFKLIKINADFKNLIFIICLDPDHVAKAIHKRYGSNKESGKEFLEKIINIPLELPLIEEADLDLFTKEKIKPILAFKNVKKTDLEELLDSIRGSYFKSPREIIRIVNSFAISFYAIGDEVNIHDLFWIEFIKIKYPKTYKAIKQFAGNFNNNLFFIDNINFNDAFSDEKGESGFRKKLLNNHKKAYAIVDFLFPMVKTGTVSAFQGPKMKPNNILDAELRINHVNHFEKYFSFHTQGKISELSFSNFRANIISEKNEEALNVLNEMIKNANERKIVYRITSEIEVVSDELHDKLLAFLINNVNHFTETSDVNPHSIEIIQSIAKKLVLKPDDNKNLIIYIAELLDYSQLCWYLSVFSYNNEEVQFLNEIETILIKKVKISNDHPFFNNRSISRMIMKVWAALEFDEFEKYMLKYLNTKDNILTFILVFPSIWNRTINGTFKEEDFKFLVNTVKLDSKLIFDRIKEFIPELKKVSTSDETEASWGEYSDNSALDNIRQFSYWHLMKEEQDKIDNTEFAGPPPTK